MSAETLTDDDTGQEILYFIRRGRPYLYLRDAQTRLFIARLHAIELRFYMVVDYSEERARKGNPLYVDGVASTPISPEVFTDMESIETKLGDFLADKVGENFGAFVMKELLEDAGVEHGSEVRREFLYTDYILRRGRRVEVTKVQVNKVYWFLVWKHHVKDAPRMKEGWGTL